MSNECVFAAVEGVCDTPLHLFGQIFRLIVWLYRSLQGVCDMPLLFFAL